MGAELVGSLHLVHFLDALVRGVEPKKRLALRQDAIFGLKPQDIALGMAADEGVGGVEGRGPKRHGKDGPQAGSIPGNGLTVRGSALVSRWLGFRQSLVMHLRPLHPLLGFPEGVGFQTVPVLIADAVGAIG